jgi:hypothetical protein
VNTKHYEEIIQNFRKIISGLEQNIKQTHRSYLYIILILAVIVYTGSYYCKHQQYPHIIIKMVSLYTILRTAAAPADEYEPPTSDEFDEENPRPRPNINIPPNTNQQA